LLYTLKLLDVKNSYDTVKVSGNYDIYDISIDEVKYFKVSRFYYL